jgi:hypothetical protein
MEHENAQKRIREIFRPWRAPANFKIEVFVIRVGEWGGHMLGDCEIRQRFTSFARCSLPSSSRRAP